MVGDCGGNPRMGELQEQRTAQKHNRLAVDPPEQPNA
jgi:hypothetical protein